MTPSHRVLVSLGSNIEPAHHIPAAIELLEEDECFNVLAVSRIYRSAAVGPAGQPEFHNAAVLIETGLEPLALRTELRRVEAVLGRERTGDKYAPRTIDLDIVMIEGMATEIEGAGIPDPDIARFAHLAVPMADIAPEWPEPSTGFTLRQIADRLAAEQEIRPMTHEIAPINKTSRYALEGRMEEVTPNEVYDADYERTVRAQLIELGEDPEREGLLRTPLRVAKAMDFLTSGYTGSLEQVVNNAVFEADTDEMVLVRDIEFYSLCEHHMLPFFGRAHVAYVPDRHIIGLSKIARIVDLFARRLQVQERLTSQVADAVAEVLDPHGVGVVMEGSHFCMMMRGVQKQGSSMITSAMRGSFKDNTRTRSEFLDLIAKQ
ncbi:MAG: GTP cyclohydrolase I FolE [Actinobacteria bacterium]|nr:GTP cyclohydrolase I FolE [Actinomycetota bacterium]